MGDSADTSYRRLTLDQIVETLGAPDVGAVQKVRSNLDLTSRRFIAHSPFLCMSTGDGIGSADCSPRGDEPGFVRVLDDRTLAIPDRSGNNLADSFRNLATVPGIGLLFFVPGLRETLRVNGTAYVTDDDGLRRRFLADGRMPKLAIVVRVTEVYLHCGKSLIRSGLWKPESQDLAAVVAASINIFSMQQVEHGSAALTSSELGEVLEGGYVSDL